MGRAPMSPAGDGPKRLGPSTTIGFGSAHSSSPPSSSSGRRPHHRPTQISQPRSTRQNTHPPTHPHRRATQAGGPSRPGEGRPRPMNSRRDFRSHRAALFDGIEEGGIRATAYSSREIHEHENDQAMDSLHDRVSVLKRLTGDIHEEVENHNRMLDRMGNDMDASRGFLSGTVDKFKMVFETKSSRRMATMVASFIAVFLLIYYLTK